MKKILIVVALAAMLVFALAGSALAAGINHSGQQRLGKSLFNNGAGPGQDAMVGGSGLPTAGAGTFTYMDWNNALGTNSGDNSPHGNYTTTTVKCVVCHAVHYAAPGGATVASGNQQADTLLRMKASEACIFCHATNGFSVTGNHSPVYNGLGAAILAPGATGGNTDTGHIVGTNCSYCHTTVHGAYEDNSVAALGGFLLKNMTATDVQHTGATTANMLDAITAIDHNAVNQGFAPGAALAGTIGEYAGTNSVALREQAVGIFCAECHVGAYATGAPGAATNVYESGGTTLTAYSGHRIAASATTTWNADGSVSSGMRGLGSVAWKPATNCKSCHDSQDNYGHDAFPHSWGTWVPSPATWNGSKMWLTSASDASGFDATTLPTGGGANAYNSATGGPQLSDGVCLKCHVSPDQSAGEGITF